MVSIDVTLVGTVCLRGKLNQIKKVKNTREMEKSGARSSDMIVSYLSVLNLNSLSLVCGPIFATKHLRGYGVPRPRTGGSSERCPHSAFPEEERALVATSLLRAPGLHLPSPPSPRLCGQHGQAQVCAPESAGDEYATINNAFSSPLLAHARSQVHPPDFFCGVSSSSSS